jgi:outer membrane protein TolC
MSNVSTCDFKQRLAELLALALAFGLLFATAATRAETPPDAAPVETVVAGLVDEALRTNLELDAAGAEVSARVAALDAARARYLPALALDARYSAADGGRTIDFPVGDLLNPVYATLNQLTGTSHFPSVSNQSIALLRRREQDTHLALTQPLYDARIGAAHAASKADLDGAEAARRALAGRLMRDMRTAYFRWLGAGARVRILEATLELARENERVNQSLYDHGTLTPDHLYRAQADALEIEQSLLAARNGLRLAASYVNLLRNADFDRPLPVARIDEEDVGGARDALLHRLGVAALTPTPLAGVAVDRRAELQQLDAALAAATAGERLARAAFKPQLALAVDAGTQGEGYGFSSNDRYVLASLVLRFNFFNGGADQAGLQSARAAGRLARDRHQLAEQQVRLEVQSASDAVEVSLASLATAARRAEAARAAFRIAARKRDLGQVNQAEFLDARRALTDAELNRTLTRTTALENLAALEYAVGGPSPTPTPETSP